jgi:Protein of unknown function (DUF3800)
MNATTPGQFRLFYVDDSGSSDSGLVVYGFLECPARAWRGSLQRLLDLRADLHLRHGISPDYQLHAASFATGHGNPSPLPGWNRQPHLRSAVVEQILTHLAADPDLRIGAIYRATTARRHAYQQHRVDVYRRLVAHLDQRLHTDGEHGLVFTDGNGSDPSYAAAHRAITHQQRHLVEDPIFQRSARSHWLQMADLVAWTAFQHLRRNPNRRYAWAWYTDHLQPRDLHNGPLAM